MKRPSKKEIKEAVERLKQPNQGGSGAPDMHVPRPQEKKANKNRIRKKGVG